MLTELRKRREEHSEKFINELENIKNNKSEIKNTITKMKNTLEGINLRLVDAEEHISDLIDKIMVITQTEQQKKKTMTIV